MRIDLNAVEIEGLQHCLLQAIARLNTGCSQGLQVIYCGILSKLQGDGWMNISENLAHQMLLYLEGQSDCQAKLLRDQLKYCIELHREALEHPESTGIYQVRPNSTTFRVLDEASIDSVL